MQANKMLLFQKICPKKCSHAPNFKIGSGLKIFNAHYLHNLHRAIASSIYNVGTARKLLFRNFNF